MLEVVKPYHDEVVKLLVKAKSILESAKEEGILKTLISNNIYFSNYTIKDNKVIFGGRLGQYKYYDMAPVIEQVLNMEID